MADHGLLSRLEKIRRTIRGRLLTYGICAVLAGGVASFLTVVTLDWLLWFPAALRLIVAVLFFAGFALAAMHWILKPLRAEVTIEQIAARLERRFENLRDRLSSTLQFLRIGEGADSPLAAKVVAQTEALVAATPLDEALTPQPLLRAAGTLIAAGCALLLIAVVAPHWVRTGWTRYTAPLSQVEWPRTVDIEPLTGDLKVAIGESATVSMRVRRGLTDTLRGVLRLKDSGGDLVPLVMQRTADGEFNANVDAITRDLVYWFEAGDDTTESTLFRIRAIHRPELLECLATVEPPVYAHSSAPRTHDLKDGTVRAPIGGTVSISIRSSKPLWTAAEPVRTGLRMSDGTFQPLTVSDSQPTQATLRWTVATALEFRVEIADDEGFENRGGAAYSILAIQDQSPTCVIVEPQTLVEITPKASLQLTGRVEDDQGLARVELIMERPADGSVTASPVHQHEPVVGLDGKVEIAVDAAWDAAAHPLTPGETVYLVLSAIDNCPGEVCPQAGTDSGQRGRSAPLPVRIIGEAELEARTRDEMAALEARLRQIVLEQTALRDATGVLAAIDSDTGLTPAQQDAAASYASAEARLTRALREVASRLGALRERLERNQSGDAEARRQLGQLEGVLGETASGPMTSAATALNEAGESSKSPAEQRDLLKNAEQDESVAVDRLRGVMQILGRWGDFQGVLARTRDLLDRQQELRTQTLERGKETLGKSTSELTEEEAAEIKRTQRQQEQLGEDVEQMLAQMEQLAGRIKDKDPSGAEAMDAAMRSARSQDLLKRVRSAASGIGENRTAAAAIDQQAAAETLKRMVSALRKREERELELLRKQVRKAEEQVAELLEQQKALRGETAEKGRTGTDDDTYDELTDRQRTLRRNTRLVADEIAEEEKMTEAARLVREATVPMGEAEVMLQDRELDDALPAQDAAMLALTEAIEQLAALDEAVAQQELQRNLAQIHEDLERLLAMQTGINTGIEELLKSVTAHGRVDRSDAREAARLARDQAAAQQALEEVRPELQKVPVFDWALNRVAGWMQSCRDSMEQRKVDDELELTAGRITRELEQLIRAVRETQEMPMDQEFAEAETPGGGGSGAASQSNKPIPTVAELLVLKAMQQDIQARTRSLHEEVQPETAAEGKLRELRTLGEDQAQVKALTEMLVAKSKEN